MEPLLRKVDAVLVRVPSIDEGLSFYRDRLGQRLRWRTETMAAVALGDSELVLSTELNPEVDLLVDSVPAAVRVMREAGSTVVMDPKPIDVGLVAVVNDPFGNSITLVDLSNGPYEVDDAGYAVRKK